ncbi:beta-xylosidase [Parabacteroides sp. PFB2-12]|uniref:glycoside hydrolase family 43 protein n=1 Tax=unclassified Parabacteroides TaxID=2649774 RepID=UPI0024744482|nr:MULTISPECIES: glycoside hydrolase 43 family protein [unclassified Parabacteroides]MDH6342072.1 beta-xylosidase [Parabacteroides sp. PM6-13]MDH6389491.1 beta-xylosidase [Parabacteroides sp. PFB2-12]
MKRKVLYFILFLSCYAGIHAQPYTSKVWKADLGNGMYRNPVLYADYADPDIIRVGDDYFMTASSFNCVPGLPILHSKDLVNWQIINYALKDLYMEGVEPVGFFDKAQHGRGVWAPCIRYHNGEYMIYWGDPDFGIYVVKTKDIYGRWDKPIRVLPGKGRIDPSPLFDDDGKVYLVHAWAGSRASMNSVMTLCEMNSDGTRVIGEEVLIYDGNDGVNHTVEGGKFYKREGYYYLLAPAGGVATGWQLAMRSKHIYGPYEVKTVLIQGDTETNGPHQGGLVDTPSGEYWFLHFQDKGAYGRISHLQPVEWKEGWPVIGRDTDGDGCGEPVRTHKKPNVGRSYPVETPVDSDEFNEPAWGKQWQWHANPQQTWGYPTPYGYIRLYGQYYPDKYTNFWDIPNLLMQKFPAPEFTATTKLSTILLNENDKAGLIVMGWDYAYIAILKTADGYALEYSTCKDAEQKTPETLLQQIPLKDIRVEERYNYKTPIPSAEIYLRVHVDKEAVCTFSYSLNGKKYHPLKQSFKARQGKWIGAKTGLFILNDRKNTSRSWVDADWFRIEK